jgi:ubiquinone/menaquinone biosynthesis C-methylase UbiE
MSSVKEKYDRISKFYDFLKSGDTRRWSPAQKIFFQGLRGRVLYVGVGPGPEIVNFPPGLDITAIDISEQMLRAARRRADVYPGTFRCINMDVAQLGFPDQAFDTVLGVCVFCTVERPIEGLRELRRVLKPGGKLMMFEHVLSRYAVFAAILKLMSRLTVRLSGTHLDRNTVENVRRAGFTVESELNIYLDIVKAITARPSDPPTTH